MPILLLFVLIEIFGIPLLLLGIISKLKPNSRYTSPFRSLLPVLLAVGISLLFLLPLILFSDFYFTFLMCVGGVLLVVYFFVKVHGNDIKANLKVNGSILVLGIAGILAAIFVAVMPGEEEQQYNYATAHQLARALGMRPVEKNVVFKDAKLIIKGDTVIGRSNYFALPPPVFNARGKLFYHLLSQPGTFNVIKPRDGLQNEQVAESLFSPVHYYNKTLCLYVGDGRLATMNINGQLAKSSVQVGSYASQAYLVYQDKAITSDAGGIYVVSLRTSDILWQRKYKEYEASFNTMLDGNLLVININKDIQQKNSSFTEQQCLAVNLDNMSIAWQHRPVYVKSGGPGLGQAWAYWAGNHAVALPAGAGYDVIATQTGRILCHFNQGQPHIQYLTTNRLYGIDSTQTLTAWNLQTQTRLWQRPADATVLVHQNSIVCKHNDTLSVVDMRTGEVKKRLLLKQPLPPTLAIQNNVLHVDDTLYR